MHANVREWCADRCKGDPFLRVIRGGGWAGGAVGSRGAGLPDRGSNAVGFRVALVPSGR
jgi:formylglycine-generating enzyme required for sulfatase activity